MWPVKCSLQIHAITSESFGRLQLVVARIVTTAYLVRTYVIPNLAAMGYASSHCSCSTQVILNLLTFKAVEKFWTTVCTYGAKDASYKNS